MLITDGQDTYRLAQATAGNGVIPLTSRTTSSRPVCGGDGETPGVRTELRMTPSKLRAVAWFDGVSGG